MARQLEFHFAIYVAFFFAKFRIDFIDLFLIQACFVRCVTRGIILILYHLCSFQPIPRLIGFNHQIRLLGRVQPITIRVVSAILHVIVVSWIVAGVV